MTWTLTRLPGAIGDLGLSRREGGCANPTFVAPGCRQSFELLSPALLSVAFGWQSCLSPLLVFCYSHLDSVD